MAFKMKGFEFFDSPITKKIVKKDKEFKAWADNELKNNASNWTKGGNNITWVDTKGRSLRQVYEGVKREQRKL